MELNQYDTELKNVVMEAFGRETILTRAQLLEIFDNDELFAAPIVQALINDKQITSVAPRGAGLLPEAISKVIPIEKPAANRWIERTAWFLAGVIITIIMVWLVSVLGHHHHKH